MIVSLVTRWTTPFAYSLMSIYGDIGSSLFNEFSGIDHTGVSNTALPRYEYSACWEMLAGARGEIILVACSFRILDLCGANISSSSAGSSSSSWVIVGTYAWRELGGGVTCEKILGVI